LYKEDTPMDEQTKEGHLVAMKLGTKEKIAHLTNKLGKFIIVANPSSRKEWLEEVSTS